MDTVRECSPSLLTNAPEREAAPAANGHIPDQGVALVASPVVENLDKPASNGKSAVPANVTAVVNDQDRFSPTYTDPLFPRKKVPYSHVKRGFDILLAGGGLVFLSPLMFLVALLVRLTSRGPEIGRAHV